MTPDRTIAVVCFLTFALLGPGSALAAPSKICESKLELKVAARDTAWFTCDGGLRGADADGELYALSSREDDPPAPATHINGAVTIRLIANTQLKYSEVHFPFELHAGKSYVLKIAPPDIQ